MPHVCAMLCDRQQRGASFLTKYSGKSMFWNIELDTKADPSICGVFKDRARICIAIGDDIPPCKTLERSGAIKDASGSKSEPWACDVMYYVQRSPVISQPVRGQRHLRRISGRS